MSKHETVEGGSDMEIEGKDAAQVEGEANSIIPDEEGGISDSVSPLPDGNIVVVTEDSDEDSAIMVGEGPPQNVHVDDYSDVKQEQALIPLFDFIKNVDGKGIRLKKVKTFGVMTIEYERNPTKYMIAASGVATSLQTGKPSKMKKLLDQVRKSKPFTQLQKRVKQENDGSQLYLADMYNSFDCAGAPPALQASYQERSDAAAKSRLFWGNFHKQVDSKKFKLMDKAAQNTELERMIRDSGLAGKVENGNEGPSIALLKVMMTDPNCIRAISENNGDVQGYSREQTKMEVQSLANLIGGASKMVKKQLLSAWDMKTSEMPLNAVKIFEHTASVQRMLDWAWSGQSSKWLYLLFGISEPLARARTQGSQQLVNRQRGMLGSTLSFVQNCWASNGLERMQVGTAFRSCAEDNALMYLKECKEFLTDSPVRAIRWTSVEREGVPERSSLKNKALCQFCAINFPGCAKHEITTLNDGGGEQE